MSKKKVSKNYLDMIPVHGKKYEFETDVNGSITILIENRGIFNGIARYVFHKPKISHVHLDEMGNYIWPLMDGNRTIHDIAGLVEERFGEKAKPLYPRLVQYMRTLQSYEFIELKENSSCRDQSAIL